MKAFKSHEGINPSISVLIVSTVLLLLLLLWHKDTERHRDTLKETHTDKHTQRQYRETTTERERKRVVNPSNESFSNNLFIWFMKYIENYSKHSIQTLIALSSTKFPVLCQDIQRSAKNLTVPRWTLPSSLLYPCLHVTN